ncbi:MAG TPA: A/G-specific adenine glycosylase [Anaerolineae bacterium]|nr:A/G-specific adenine glycosylase [Anaerolineae bacterium]HQI85924.1 A/G-specific adenine glycosylase [Anaerolineae bacterium]
MVFDNATIMYLQTHRVAAQERLLTWFARHARDLPWRHDRTSYRVWVAEVMLQQTQVEKVREYYERFMARFPTVESLAVAPLDDVLKQWEGMGYYSRARALHRAAQEVVARYHGELPADVDALRRLPGIGTYTAGAIASIAFGIPAPAVDGNVRRVFGRVLALAAPSAADLEAAVRAWMPDDAPGAPGTPGAFTEALMELGATLCRPKSPQCLLCPWRDLCRARALGQPEAFPAPQLRKPIPHYDVVAAVALRDDGRVLVARRRQDDRLGGLWEFPGGKREEGETLPAALRRELREEMDIEVAVGEQLIVVEHAYTHFRITLYAFACRLVAGEPVCLDCDGFQWATPEEIAALPMSVADRKIAAVL